MVPSRLLTLAGLALLMVGAGVHIAAGNSSAGVSSIHAQGVDDAYISYRFAQNLVAGHGLVFNPGERVEGYTNPLTVLLAALLLGFCRPDQVYWLVSAFNLAVVLTAAVMFADVVKAQLGNLGRRPCC